MTCLYQLFVNNEKYNKALCNFTVFCHFILGGYGEHEIKISKWLTKGTANCRACYRVH